MYCYKYWIYIFQNVFYNTLYYDIKQRELINLNLIFDKNSVINFTGLLCCNCYLSGYNGPLLTNKHSFILWWIFHVVLTIIFYSRMIIMYFSIVVLKQSTEVKPCIKKWVYRRRTMSSVLFLVLHCSIDRYDFL